LAGGQRALFAPMISGAAGATEAEASVSDQRHERKSSDEELQPPTDVSVDELARRTKLIALMRDPKIEIDPNTCPLTRDDAKFLISMHKVKRKEMDQHAWDRLYAVAESRSDLLPYLDETGECRMRLNLDTEDDGPSGDITNVRQYRFWQTMWDATEHDVRDVTTINNDLFTRLETLRIALVKWNASIQRGMPLPDFGRDVMSAMKNLPEADARDFTPRIEAEEEVTASPAFMPVAADMQDWQTMCEWLRTHVSSSQQSFIHARDESEYDAKLKRVREINVFISNLLFEDDEATNIANIAAAIHDDPSVLQMIDTVDAGYRRVAKEPIFVPTFDPAFTRSQFVEYCRAKSEEAIEFTQRVSHQDRMVIETLWKYADSTHNKNMTVEDATWKTFMGLYKDARDCGIERWAPIARMNHDNVVSWRARYVSDLPKRKDGWGIAQWITYLAQQPHNADIPANVEYTADEMSNISDINQAVKTLTRSPKDKVLQDMLLRRLANMSTNWDRKMCAILPRLEHPFTGQVIVIVHPRFAQLLPGAMKPGAGAGAGAGGGAGAGAGAGAGVGVGIGVGGAPGGGGGGGSYGWYDSDLTEQWKIVRTVFNALMKSDSRADLLHFRPHLNDKLTLKVIVGHLTDLFQAATCQIGDDPAEKLRLGRTWSTTLRPIQSLQWRGKIRSLILAHLKPHGILWTGKVFRIEHKLDNWRNIEHLLTLGVMTMMRMEETDDTMMNALFNAGNKNSGNYGTTILDVLREFRADQRAQTPKRYYDLSIAARRYAIEPNPTVPSARVVPTATTSSGSHMLRPSITPTPTRSASLPVRAPPDAFGIAPRQRSEHVDVRPDRDEHKTEDENHSSDRLFGRRQRQSLAYASDRPSSPTAYDHHNLDAAASSRMQSRSDRYEKFLFEPPVRPNPAAL